MPPKRKRAVPVNNVSDVEEPTVRQAATNVGFYDLNIYSKLYTFWRAQVHWGIQNWNCFGAGEAGTSRWSEFCEWVASQKGMAPRGMLKYTIDSSIRKSMWETIFRARVQLERTVASCQDPRLYNLASSSVFICNQTRFLLLFFFFCFIYSLPLLYRTA